MLGHRRRFAGHELPVAETGGLRSRRRGRRQRQGRRVGGTATLDPLQAPDGTAVPGHRRQDCPPPGDLSALGRRVEQTQGRAPHRNDRSPPALAQVPHHAQGAVAGGRCDLDDLYAGRCRAAPPRSDRPGRSSPPRRSRLPVHQGCCDGGVGQMGDTGHRSASAQPGHCDRSPPHRWFARDRPARSHRGGDEDSDRKGRAQHARHGQQRHERHHHTAGEACERAGREAE